ncbi:MAG: hypothetical protein NXH70_09320 [Hyphomonas sp.]|nr:hypothetical protein [Hyphomonas sp.]
MLHPSTKKLIDRLAEMTELGKLDWTEGKNGSLVYSTEGYSVCLPEGAQEIIIQSIDGKELERAATDELASTMSDQGTSYAQIVTEMGAEANRYARGTETAISSLLAGMAEPEAPVEEDETDLAEQGPEDPGDESAALASEGIANHELKPEPEQASEPEPAPEIEPEIETAAEPDAFDAPEAAPVEMASAENDAVSSIETEPETDIASPADLSGFEAAETDGEEVHTESEVTEAVARLADEVNNRPDPAPVDTVEIAEQVESTSNEDEPSTIGIAAAAAMGVVASAAGLSQDDSAEDEVQGSIAEEVETTEVAATDTTAETEAPPVMEADSAPAYVPFGLEASEEPVTPSDDAAAHSDGDEGPYGDVTPVTFGEMDQEREPVETMSEPITAAADMTDTESVSEVETLVIDESVESAVSDPEIEVAAEPEVTPFFTADAPAANAEPQTETVLVEETASVMTPEPEPAFASVSDAPETATLPVDDAPETETSEDATVEADPEPVLAAPEAPQTYSLSGIGAGFGLGALSAKTEASGIPGPTAVTQAEPEKIVIDATEDVLPELEGNLDLEKMEAAVSEINFGKTDAGEATTESDVEDESDGDILKPRTRFNPWD